MSNGGLLLRYIQKADEDPDDSALGTVLHLKLRMLFIRYIYEFYHSALVKHNTKSKNKKTKKNYKNIYFLC